MIARRLAVAAALPSLLFAAGCGGSEEGESRATFTIPFEARVGEEPFGCRTFDGLGTRPSTAAMQDLRFYLHDFRLVTEEGEEVALELVDDGVWQYRGVVLLDFEDGTGSCTNGSTVTRREVVGEAPARDYRGLRFKLGVPAELNHLDASIAPSPLNLTSMFWSWNDGYKFLRLDADVGVLGFSVHLGSAGCSEPGVCAFPNRPEIRLDGFDPGASQVVADVAALLAENDLEFALEGPSGIVGPDCMGLPTDVGCPRIFDALGLGDREQRFFRTEPVPIPATAD